MGIPDGSCGPFYRQGPEDSNLPHIGVWVLCGVRRPGRASNTGDPLPVLATPGLPFFLLSFFMILQAQAMARKPARPQAREGHFKRQFLNAWGQLKVMRRATQAGSWSKGTGYV